MSNRLVASITAFDWAIFLRRKEVNQQAVFSMRNDLIHGRRPGSHHHATRRHGFHHRPRQDERVSKVDVSRRYLQHVKECFVGEFADKMHATTIKLPVDLRQIFLAIRAFI